VRAVTLEEKQVERAQHAIEARGKLVFGLAVELELDVLFPQYLTRARQALLYGCFVESQRPTQGRHGKTAERAQRERDRALDRNGGMTADEHHLQQILVAIVLRGGCFEIIEAFTRCDPPGTPNCIDHAAPRGDEQPGAGPLGDIRMPALDPRHESLLKGSLDQVQATCAE